MLRINYLHCFDSFLLIGRVIFFYVFKILSFNVFIELIFIFVLIGIASRVNCSLPFKLNVVDIAFYHDFHSGKIRLSKHDHNCFKLVHHPGIIRCTEYAHLLRTAAVTEKWQEQQRRQGYFLFTDTEAGIREVHAHIIGMHDSTLKAVRTHHQINRVTGQIVRYSTDVKTYTFYDLKTHIRSKINATPEHRFYVVNKRAFIPLAKITSEDQLINESGRSVKLLYAVKNGGNSNKHLLPVYNLEVSDHHVYFAGADRILVHNGCFDDFAPDHLTDKSTKYAARFVNSQVNHYIKYSPTKMLLHPELEDRVFMDEIVGTFNENMEKMRLMGTQAEMKECIIKLSVATACGNCAEMCLVGKKVLLEYGFKQDVRIMKYADHAFLVLGDKAPDLWISDPWGEVFFPESQKTERLKIYRRVDCVQNDKSYHGMRGELLPFEEYVKKYPESTTPGFVEGY